MESGYSTGIEWSRVKYGCSREDSKEVNREVYSMGIQWRRIKYEDTMEKGTVWGFSGEG